MPNAGQRADQRLTPAVADNGYFGGGAYPGPYPVPFGEG
jgi:hypothetical protein